MSNENPGCPCASQLAAQLRAARIEITRLHGGAMDHALEVIDLEGALNEMALTLIDVALQADWLDKVWARSRKGWGCLSCDQHPCICDLPEVK